jgi:hypothetical protein
MNAECPWSAAPVALRSVLDGLGKGSTEVNQADHFSTGAPPGLRERAGTAQDLHAGMVNHFLDPPMTLPSTTVPLVRREALRDGLLHTVDLLKQRRADQIGDSDIADYVALDWLEWNGGGLRLTTVGSNLCRQLTTQQR